MNRAVIGAGYGDEGKGRTVNDFATKDTLVVRFNGGAQAGHTVVQDGKRHVFSHIGAATFKGAATHLSRFFVCNPIVFLRETQELGYIPENITMSPDCYVTTPIDVFLNRKGKLNRKHGTVGLGFGETIERYENGYGNLAFIYDWLKMRSEELGIKWKEYESHLKDEMEYFHYCYDYYMNFVPSRDDDIIISSYDDVIFEGAQGLMLDQSHAFFPHVTRSNTGIKNVLALMPKGSVQVTYVTRTYTTRHGAGPLPHELYKKPYDAIVDETNIDTGIQGKLRFSYLNLDDIAAEITKDAALSGFRYNINVTCMDQVPNEIQVILGGRVKTIYKSHLQEFLLQLTNAEYVSCTYGAESPERQYT